jgi:type II secretory pathway component PulC
MTKTKRWRMGALALLALAALLAVRLAFGARNASSSGTATASGSAETPEPFQWPKLDAGAWKLFRSGAPAAPQAAAGALSARYRLAGVFLILSDVGRSGAEHRCAILDDLQTQQQYLAAEEESFEQIRVVTVENDHVVLSDGVHEETIYLAAGTLPGHEKAGATNTPAEPPPQILETNRFGNRIGETRWEFNRQAILDYYQEMMDNPERLASLFMAMEADRDVEGKVAGYKLNMDVGEKEFYTQIGLQQGDVVRKVNSMRMTSQRRAEYFIGEFVQNRLGAVVFDIERNGEPKKLIYLIK